MRKINAAAGSGMFAVMAPGVVAGLAPWLLTRWQYGRPEYPLAVQGIGIALVVLGGGVLTRAFVQFAVQGLGTPSPTAPTAHLVVLGLYRHVRNPMYLAVLAVIVGQGCLLGRPVLFGYAAGIGVAFAAFVRWYEQPTLTRRYGAEYEAYLRTVPGWWPRLRPASSTQPDPASQTLRPDERA
jgi:protein-S-isoprenylcysteine O-methyltransferase Ste14